MKKNIIGTTATYFQTDILEDATYSPVLLCPSPLYERIRRDLEKGCEVMMVVMATMTSLSRNSCFIKVIFQCVT